MTAKKTFGSFFKTLMIDTLRTSLILAIIALLSISDLFEKGYIIRAFGGVVQGDIQEIESLTGTVSEGKITRKDNGLEEKEVLRKKMSLGNKGMICITANAKGKFKLDYCPAEKGFVNIIVYIDDIECSQSSSFVGPCEFRNDSKSLSTGTSFISEIDGGDHEIKVEASYFGNIELDKTRLIYLAGWERRPATEKK